MHALWLLTEAGAGSAEINFRGAILCLGGALGGNLLKVVALLIDVFDRTRHDT